MSLTQICKKTLTHRTQISLCHNLLNTHKPTQARYSAIHYQHYFHTCPPDALVVALSVQPGNLKSFWTKRNCHILCDARKLGYIINREVSPSLICTVNGNWCILIHRLQNESQMIIHTFKKKAYSRVSIYIYIYISSPISGDICARNFLTKFQGLHDISTLLNVT